MILAINVIDPVEKKLIRTRDVVFIEYQTIEDIDKVERSSSSSNNNLIDVDPILWQMVLYMRMLHNKRKNMRMLVSQWLWMIELMLAMVLCSLR